MPEEWLSNWDDPSYIGETGVILRIIYRPGRTNNNIKGFDVCFPKKKWDKYPPEAFYFKQELEPVVKVGEQLTFNFMNEVT